MIKLKRGPAPKFLFSPKVQMAKEKLQRSYENSMRQERFQFDVSLLGQVKDDLLQLCNGKCAYCDSSLGVVSKGDVENFRPKSGARGLNDEYAPRHYWWLAYEWENLLIACQICNQKYKRDFFPLEREENRAAVGEMGDALFREQALLIDPTAEDPDDHITFCEDGSAEPKSKKGKCTIDILGLNRGELVLKRQEAAEVFRMRLQQMNIKNVSKFSENLKYITELYSDYPRQEYAATLRTLFATWLEQNTNALTKTVFKKFTGFVNKFRVSQTEITEEDITEASGQFGEVKRFSIKTIEIENFKSIENISLEILQGSTSEVRESWLLLLGDNGIGKSSILQAIALALAGQNQLNLLTLDVMDFLRDGTSSGFVKIQSYEHDQPVVLKFDESGFHTDLTLPPTFIMAYGSTRLLPKGAIQPNPYPVSNINVANLFDYSIALCDPHEWLKDDDEFRDRVAPAFFDLLALRGEDRLYLENGKIKIAQNGSTEDLDGTSDGYKTIVALVTDIMKTLSVDRAGYHNAHGIVLVDEIGNHLHPRWRMKIVSALRRAFPHLQFIVTTHEPLCLQGLSHGEVVVLVRDNEKKIKALDKNLLPDHSLMRIDQLLTSDLFGLINIMGEQAEKTYEEYFQLLSKKENEKTDDDKVRIREISTMLGEAEVLGTTPGEQVLYKVINETFAKKIREEGFKTKETLKQETVIEVKTFLKEKKYKWL